MRWEVTSATDCGMIGGVDRKVNTTERNRAGLEEINHKNSMSHVCVLFCCTFLLCNR